VFADNADDFSSLNPVRHCNRQFLARS